MSLSLAVVFLILSRLDFAYAKGRGKRHYVLPIISAIMGVSYLFEYVKGLI